MAKKTINYSFDLPSYDESADIELLNNNTVNIDAELKKNENNTGEVADDLATHLADKASQEKLGHIKIGAGGSIDVNGVYVPTGFKIGSFTRDISLENDNQAITGVGFKPRAIIFLASVNGVANLESIGFDNATTTICKLNFGNDVASSFYITTVASIRIHISSQATSNGKIASFDTDGFTVNWIKSGSVTGTATIGYIAFK